MAARCRFDRFIFRSSTPRRTPISRRIQHAFFHSICAGSQHLPTLSSTFGLVGDRFRRGTGYSFSIALSGAEGIFCHYAISRGWCVGHAIEPHSSSAFSHFFLFRHGVMDHPSSRTSPCHLSTGLGFMRGCLVHRSRFNQPRPMASPGNPGLSHGHLWRIYCLSPSLAGASHGSRATAEINALAFSRTFTISIFLSPFFANPTCRIDDKISPAHHHLQCQHICFPNAS